MIIQNEAERSGMTANALINKVLQKYVDTLRFYEYGNMISMSTDTFMVLLDQFSKEEIEELAYGLGNMKTKESLLRRGQEINYDNFVHYVSRILGEYNGWFRCDCVSDHDNINMHLSHPYNIKWSYFIANYVSSILRDILGLKCTLTILETAVNFKIDR